MKHEVALPNFSSSTVIQKRLARKKRGY